jgi:hypothetical protein
MEIDPLYLTSTSDHYHEDLSGFGHIFSLVVQVPDQMKSSCMHKLTYDIIKNTNTLMKRKTNIIQFDVYLSILALPNSRGSPLHV